MKSKKGEIFVKKVEVELNKKLLATMFLVTCFGIILSGCLAYVFSDSLFTIFWSLVLGLTISFLLNYFVIISSKIVTDVNIELGYEDDSDEEYTKFMKIE